MAMQYDVKSFHVMTGTPAGITARTRLKGAVVSNSSSGTASNVTFSNNTTVSGTYNVPGTTVCTITTSTPHGLTTGDRIWVNFTSGTSTDNTYTVTVTSTVAFTVAVTSATTSGNVTIYPQTLMEIEITNSVPVCVTIPGEGILATDGIFVGAPTNIGATVFYG
jgi:flagellin-like hook-associated protein FlgL